MMTIVTAKMNIIMRRRLAAAGGPRRGAGRVAFIINVTLLFLAGYKKKMRMIKKKYRILHRMLMFPSFPHEYYFVYIRVSFTSPFNLRNEMYTCFFF